MRLLDRLEHELPLGDLIVDFLNVTQFAGYLSHEQITRSIRLFADRVVPHFQPGARNGGA